VGLVCEERWHVNLGSIGNQKHVSGRRMDVGHRDKNVECEIGWHEMGVC
jgi:hypothetical protein